ncbi:ribonuclease HII [Mycolicibacterium moriokaense]|nr:ribonuclease HII [Mycolicibacterium moriokaense]
MPATWPPRTVIRKSSGLRTLESALYRSGLGPVAGVDEVGRGACAGPLVVAACVLGPNRLESLAALDDSKKLNEKERERLFPLIRRYALAYHVVFIPSVEVDRRGVHVANIEGMRRAVAGLPLRPGYVLSDGFRVPGLPAPSLPVVGGDAAAACIAAASVLAKVSRDRLMVKMESEHPGYGFADHKGYSTPAHGAALARLGPCSQHRYSFINVRRVATPTGTRVVTELVRDCEPEQQGEVG